MVNHKNGGFLKMNDAVMQLGGTVYEDGYGLIAQKVMRDRRLDKGAKAIYGYLCSFAGSNGNVDGEREAFPGVSLMMSELGINSRDTYYKHRNQLIKLGYLKIEKQRKEGSKFDRNIYKIIAVPIELLEKTEEKKPCPKNSTMEKPYPKNSTTENSTTENSTTENQYTNSTSSNSTSSTSISSSIDEEDAPAIFVSKLFKENFETCNKSIEKKLAQWTTKLPVEVIADEITFAAENGAKTFRYLEIALNEDLMLKIDSVEKLAVKREDHRIAKSKKSTRTHSKPSNRQNKPVREEMKPGWYEEAMKEHEERENASGASGATSEQLEKEKQAYLAKRKARLEQNQK